MPRILLFGTVLLFPTLFVVGCGTGDGAALETPGETGASEGATTSDTGTTRLEEERELTVDEISSGAIGDGVLADRSPPITVKRRIPEEPQILLAPTMADLKK
jgi:hypothetical protein